MKLFKPLFLVATLFLPALAQNSDVGVGVPVTLSGGAMFSERLQLRSPNESRMTPGFRAVFYPTVKLGSHWFGYAAVQVRGTPYFYYDAYNPEHELYTDVIQAYVGYSFRAESMTVVLKAGSLSSAFGSFPLRYDDAENPLMDQPLSYIQTLTLRNDQLPCGTLDLIHQPYGSVSHTCGGAVGRAVGLTPVSLYGLPGVEAEVSGHRLDARVQITSGSPSNVQPFEHFGQERQWAAGAGYTVRQGFRIGMSGFHGPYLDPALAPLLPVGTTVRDFPASGVGADVQWARGRWTLTGEWQRFRYDSPNFSTSPSIQSTYAEAKGRITPRLFLAGRAGMLNPGRVLDKKGIESDQFAPKMRSYELGAGLWLNRHQLLKASYEWLKIEGRNGTRFDVAGVQLVTTFNSLNWAFK